MVLGFMPVGFAGGLGGNAPCEIELDAPLNETADERIAVDFSPRRRRSGGRLSREVLPRASRPRAGARGPGTRCASDEPVDQAIRQAPARRHAVRSAATTSSSLASPTTTT